MTEISQTIYFVQTYHKCRLDNYRICDAIILANFHKRYSYLSPNIVGAIHELPLRSLVEIYILVHPKFQNCHNSNAETQEEIIKNLTIGINFLNQLCHHRINLIMINLTGSRISMTTASVL